MDAKKKGILFLVVVIVLFCSWLVIAASVNEELADSSVAAVKVIQDCTDNTYTVTEDTYGNCNYERAFTYCANETEDGSDCTEETETLTYTCVTGSQEVEKTDHLCTPKGYLINDKVKLSTTEYTCLPSEEKGKVIVICDSKYDGNGDGICSSGESCMKFEVTGKNVVQYEKNSRDTFAKRDHTFFLGKIKKEVLK